MHVYLPIADMSANMFLLIGIGGAVGFLSGMFGVGGGFLMTPLLIFSGISPAVAVATEAPHIVASSFSGALAQWQRKNVDLKLGAVILAGGIAGAFLGVHLIRELRLLGQFEFLLSVGYVLLLGGLGALMLVESVATIIRRRRGGEVVFAGRRSQHNWLHKWPVKMRFHRSKLYISAIPPLALGLSVGLLAAVMGVGGGFLLVPAMIYILRVPTNIAIGTALCQVLVLTGVTTVLQATENKSVDLVLALLLILGGVLGAHLGAVVGDRIKGEQLRFLLAALILLVCVRLAIALFSSPTELYSISAPVGRR